MAFSPAQFWNKAADGYVQRPIKDQAAYQHKLSLTRHYLSAESRVIEIGCGTGGTAILHAPNVASYVGMDVSDRMLEHARQRPEAASLSNLSWLCSDLESLEVKPNQYNVIMALNVLHLVDAPDQWIKRFYDWLPEHGLLITSTVCLGDSPWLVRIALPLLMRLGIAPPIQIFSKTDYLSWFEGAGFELAENWQPKKQQSLFIIAKK